MPTVEECRFRHVTGFKQRASCSLGYVNIVSYLYIYISFSLGEVRLSPLIGLLYQPQMIDDACGAVGGMRIGRGNRSTRRKPTPVPLCPPQIPRDLTWARTRVAAVGSRRLTASAITQPYILCIQWVLHKATDEVGCTVVRIATWWVLSVRN
jgi:hypothetical protein